MKILYHIPYPSATGADRWIYEGWRDGFHDLGHDVYEFTAFDPLLEKARQVRPDVFMTAVNLVDFKKNYQALVEMKEKGTKICMWIHWPLIATCQYEEEYVLNHDLVDVYFGEREPEGMADFESTVEKKYHVIPNAANKRNHFPAAPVQKYQYDLVYLGAKLPMKRWFFSNVLLPVSKKYRVGIFGPYWTLKDNFYRALTKSCAKIQFKSGVDFFNKLRIQIPADEENQLYSSAKICLNFHEREQDGVQSHIIVNQRTFKIPACGGFQICDHVKPIRRYFSDKELVMANYSAQEWFELIEYYIQNERERAMIREAGIKKALSEHTYHNRVNQLLNIYSSL